MALSKDLQYTFPSLELVRTTRVIRLVGRLTFVALVVAIIAMVFVPWRQTAKGTGVVVALDPQDRPQQVLSPSKGVISYVKPGLREGSYIERGELVLRLTPFAAEGVQQIDTQIIAIEGKETAARSILAVSEQAAELQESSGRSMAESLKQDYRAANQKWEQTKNEVLAMQAELEDKRNQFRIAEEVATRGLVSREELYSKERAVEAQRAKVLKAESAVEEAYATLLSKEEEIQSKMQEIDIKNRSASQKVLEELQKLRTIEKELIDLRTKRGELDRLEVRRPFRIRSEVGRIGGKRYDQGRRPTLHHRSANRSAGCGHEGQRQ